MAFEDSDVEEQGVEEAGPPPEESGNRPFLIIAGILIGSLVLSLLCLGGYALIQVPRLRSSRATYAARVAATSIAQSTQLALSVQQTQAAANATATPTPTKPVTPTPTRTQVVAQAATSTSAATITANAATETLAALLTQVANNALTPTTTALPKSGLGDEPIRVNVPAVGIVSLGLPAFLGLFVVLVGVALAARWLRKK